jgi:hypothetical protein
MRIEKHDDFEIKFYCRLKHSPDENCTNQCPECQSLDEDYKDSFSELQLENKTFKDAYIERNDKVNELLEKLEQHLKK